MTLALISTPIGPDTMQTNHTPGPWCAIGAAVNAPARYADSQNIADCRALLPDAEIRANARLMAAAPDLLAALQDARFMVWGMTGDSAAAAPWNALLPRIDAAIARAIGA